MISFKQFLEESTGLKKSTLQNYIKKSDTQAKELDAQANQEKDPVKKLGLIHKASKRGLGAFKAHLKVGLAKESVNEARLEPWQKGTVDTLKDLHKHIKKNHKHLLHLEPYIRNHISAIKDGEPGAVKTANGFIDGVRNAMKNKIHEDGMGGGAIAAGPTNIVGSGAIAGSGGKGGEPGVDMKKRKKSPVLGSIYKRKQL